MGLPRWLGKECTCQWRRCKNNRFDPWVGKNPWRRKWHPTPVFLPGKCQGERSLAGYMGVTRNQTRLITHLRKAFHSCNEDTRNLMTQANQNWIQKLLKNLFLKFGGKNEIHCLEMSPPWHPLQSAFVESLWVFCQENEAECYQELWRLWELPTCMWTNELATVLWVLAEGMSVWVRNQDCFLTAKKQAESQSWSRSPGLQSLVGWCREAQVMQRQSQEPSGLG